MELQEIEVTIDKNGQVQVQVRGVKGMSCLDLTHDLEEALGGEVIAREMTPEAQEGTSEELPTEDPGRVAGEALAWRVDNVLRIHQVLGRSRANGPGIRLAIWLQGCTLACPGCFNPETHPTRAGSRISVDDLFEQVWAVREEIEGITISGGEPLQQRRPLLALLQRIKQETGLSVIVFSGYEWKEIQKMPAHAALLDCIDVLVAGRYRQDQRLASGLRGSANKTIHLLSGRYTHRDIEATPAAEVVLTPDGEILLSGIDPLQIANPFLSGIGSR